MSAIGPGDFVECVDARPNDWDGVSRLTLRAIYRVAEVKRTTLDPHGNIRGGVRLHGVVSGYDERGRERFFDVNRFRPIYRPKSDFITSLMREAPAEQVGA